MGLFNKGKPEKIINEVNTNINSASLTNGNAFVDGEILRQMPYAKNEVLQLDESWDGNHDSTDTPNLFASWSDVYDAYIGTFFMSQAPDGLKDHDNLIMHFFFLYDRVGLFRVDDDNWLVGNYSSTIADNYGNMLQGKFTPWNYATMKPASEEYDITINSRNVDNFVNHQMSPYSIPIFLKIGYYIKVRKILWMFKKTNLRLSVLQKVIGLEAEGKEAMVSFLNDLFNQNDRFISPIQVIDITSNNKQGKERKYTINFADLSKDNQIDLSFEYRGVEINQDIEGTTQEIFRIAGIRTDLQSQSGQYDERNTNSQVQQASNYFDVRENFILKSLEKFSRKIKEKFGIDVKWESVYKQGVNDEKEKSLSINEKSDSNAR
jgi:hypothetical protein